MQLLTLALCGALLLGSLPAAILGQSAEPAASPDPLENNWSAATATPIAVNYDYQLNFICPVEQGCPGGDHDYLRLPVKIGLHYYLATTNLEPGVDTVIDLFWDDPEQPVATNDDLNPGSSLLSALEWQAPGNGELVIRVGPRTGNLQPRLSETGTTGYRFTAALAGSAKGADLKRLAQEQAGLTPTLVESTISASAAGTVAPALPEPVAELPNTPVAPTQVQIITAEVATGPAQVITATLMRAGPGEEHEQLEALKAGITVRLLGQAGGSWVFIRPDGGIRPGWVQYHNLRMLDTAQPLSIAPTSVPQVDTPQASAKQAQQWKLTRLNDLPLSRQAIQAESTAITLDIALVRANSSQTPIANTRIQIVNTFGDLISEFVTPANGRVSIQQAIEPGVALRLQVPAAGLDLPIDPAKPAIVLEIPDV